MTEIAHGIARHTDLPVERATEALTWGADEHVLIAAAAVGWLLTRKSEEPVRRLRSHVLVCSLATAILPHVLKAFIEQSECQGRPELIVIVNQETCNERTEGVALGAVSGEAIVELTAFKT